jgi:hypothetical protein
MVGARPNFLLLPILFSMAVTSWGQGFDEPARALAQKIAAVLKSHELVTLVFSAPNSDAAVALERELRGLGINTAAQAAATVTVTLSGNFRGFVWVAEIRRGEAREIAIEEWPIPPETAATVSFVIEKERLLEQESRILDLAALGHGLLVLDAESVSVYENSQRKLTIRLPVSRALPRDLRGRLFVQGDVYQAYLPGITCNGNAANGLSISCREEGLWPLGPNARGMSISTRNFFENFVLPDGLQKKMPPFFTAVYLPDHGRADWGFAGTDGRTRFYNAAFEPGPAWSGWGSDLVAIENECGSRTLLLATGTGDSTSPDSVQAFELTDSTPRPVGDPASFPGPVTALWAASDRGTALAVSRDLKSGRYAAFRLAIPCSR